MTQEVQDKLLVRKIENGTVIDHIPAWKADLVVKVLRPERWMRQRPDLSLVIVQNVASHRLGRKDLVKIDGWYVDDKEADILALIFPSVTTNLIRQWQVTKYAPQIPDVLEGRIRCPEVRCITNAEREPISTQFAVIKRQRLLQCSYCDSLLDFERIPEFIHT
jgi:aspartate carbamoyltransferase regulatory subunit